MAFHNRGWWALITKVSANIHEAVGRMYDQFPYPRYPLFVRLRWQEGYSGSSRFAASLFRDATGTPAALDQCQGRGTSPILVAGSGETLPYILRKLEPAGHRLHCVDLSSKNLRRARIRLLANLKPVDFIHDDIDHFLHKQRQEYHHIDIYGVLHHLANPALTLKEIGKSLHSRGTMRLMVYNSEARNWIFQLQRAFALCGLDPYLKSDRKRARQYLAEMQREVPALRYRLGLLGAGIFNNPSRLVDTFFHEREARIPMDRWLSMIQEAGLHVMGMMDRYGELDDLENPLWAPPSSAELSRRARAGMFRHNLELFLHKARPEQGEQHSTPVDTDLWSRGQKVRQQLKLPPLGWFDFPETCPLPFQTRLRLWHHHIGEVSSGDGDTDDLVRSLPTAAAARLARIGAILPGQIRDPDLRRNLCRPLVPEPGEPAPVPPAVSLHGRRLVKMVEEDLERKGRYSHRRLTTVLERLHRAQSPV